ncbi:type IV pilus secretin PilQ [Pseudobdellovibrio exovorus]|uniref:Fimbrial assembly protein n=1 Tax=Pseudobdellovibrio exovorus JSS TaxID=1184267 RepID=M4V6J9_9BACT|nr:type IV pilus secretin PilQ [Pseudobdellovibrio exovorus]AGH94977.1 fimbrial assembly protein [Pseudobdellovibrio exovorus JSS]
MAKKILSVLMVATFIFTSCTSHRKVEVDDEFAVDSDSSTGADFGNDLSLDDLNFEGSSGSSPTAGSSGNIDQDLEDELNSLSASTSSPSAPVADPNELTLDDEFLDAPPPPVATAPPPAPEPPVFEEPPAPVFEPPVAVTPEPPVFEEPPLEPTPAPIVPSKPASINNVAYKANANGGTIEIGADQPLQYTTRMNSATNQLVVEVENSVIPNKLKRSLNTKDMASSIGSVDIYQNAGSNVARFVVQLRPGAEEPFIQTEGNSLLIIGSSTGGAMQTNNGAPAPYVGDSTVVAGAQPSNGTDITADGIMSSDSLEEFLISNNKFYGKKISIETNKMNVRDAFRFLADESGVNIIMDDAITGDVSLKLRDVPWDQAFILILKSKQLGFKRQGNVLRIARLDDIKKDEDEAIKMLEKRKNNAPLIVRRFFIGYANIEELEKKITQFLTTTRNLANAGAGAAAAQASAVENAGKIIADKRTNSLIVTDTEENMTRIEKLVAALDTQPPQVLIEGKVVEAKEEFTRGLGITWDSTPETTTGANRSKISITPQLDSGFAILDSQFSWGQLDILGSLTARLQLGEREDKVRVLSSPRISVLSNERATIAQTAGILIPRVQTDSNTGNVSTTFEVVQVGVNLNVTPQVSNEGTVTLDMDIERSFLARVDAQAPDKRNAKTKVIVKSGETAVIGGIFESESRDGTSGVPGLQNIPILGRLFRNDREGKSKNELVIFVTPTILKPVAGSEPRTGSF